MQQAETSRNKYGRFFLKLSLYIPFLFVCGIIFWLSSLSHPPIPSMFKFHHGDKVMHVLAFFFVGFTAVLPIGLDRRNFRMWLFLRALGLAALYGVVDELHQSFVPYRNSSTLDLTADLVGASLGIFAFWILATVLRRRRNDKESR